MNPTINLPDINSDHLRQMSEVFAQVENQSRFIVLLPGQRQAQGGSLFPGSEFVVWAVAQAMERKPGLFTGSGEDAQDLMKDHKAAVDLKVLLGRIDLLRDSAQDTLIALQSRNIRRAISTLSFVRRGEELAQEQEALRHLPLSSAQIQVLISRRIVLVQAYRVINDYYASLKAKKEQKKAAREAAKAAQQAAQGGPTLG